MTNPCRCLSLTDPQGHASFVNNCVQCERDMHDHFILLDHFVEHLKLLEEAAD
ncbi:hypothetical protein MA16_Dca021845 [Dendrobium catenatum]|uniref:Uncharacterized protein n=1 Tax=Dendrobium catenatum TaxID=906689 RepID=A0A2I0X6C0_9ASPA|nr:hypothetical protein MA16_Dca021845 [Dendrobium catenatum]